METDSTIMAERLGQIQAEKTQLSQELAAARNEIYGYRQAKYFFGGSIVLLICLVLTAFGYPLYKIVSMPEVVDHCVVESTEVFVSNKDDVITGKYKLRGVVEWGEDVNCGVFNSVDEAISTAAKLRCQIK